MTSEVDSEKPQVYVSAIFCTDIIREHGTDLLSAVRITSAFTANPARVTPELPDGSLDTSRQEVVYAPVRFHAVITFWAEQPRTFTFQMQGLKPNGERLNDMRDPVDIEVPGGELGGYTINLKAFVPGSLAGIYLFDMIIDGKVALRLPMRILHKKELPDSDTAQSENYSAAF